MGLQVAALCPASSLAANLLAEVCLIQAVALHSRTLICCNAVEALQGMVARYNCANADACMRLHYVLTFAGDDVVAKLKTGELEKMLKEVGAIKA